MRSLFLFTKISLKSRKITKENGGHCKLFTRTLQTFERFAGQKIFSLGFFFSSFYTFIFFPYSPPARTAAFVNRFVRFTRRSSLFIHQHVCVCVYIYYYIFMIFLLFFFCGTPSRPLQRPVLAMFIFIARFFFRDLIFVFQRLCRCCRRRTQTGER